MKYFSWGWQAKPLTKKFHFYAAISLPACGDHRVALQLGDTVQTEESDSWKALYRQRRRCKHCVKIKGEKDDSKKS